MSHKDKMEVGSMFLGWSCSRLNEVVVCRRPYTAISRVNYEWYAKDGAVLRTLVDEQVYLVSTLY